MTERERIKNRIQELPKGGITFKRINGKPYAYYQWTECGKQRSRRVKDEELDSLAEAIAERKELQAQLVLLNEKDREYAYYASDSVRNYVSLDTNLPIRIGNELARFSEKSGKKKKRECFNALKDYVYGDDSGKVLILYGLRRTGKTTMIQQLISEMDEETFGRTAFIQAMPGKNLSDINVALRNLESQGYRYIFIDEVTLIEEFVEGAALFSDIFAMSGMKIVLSGTDSLGFMFSEDEQLYDRCIMIHTTFIPYREFSKVLGIDSVDEYIKYGGTMSISGKMYNEDIPFSTAKATREYVDSAIAKNIQHSLKCYQRGTHFRHLRELYEREELTSAINRVVEDINHRFALDVLTREFKSGDLSLSANNLRRDRVNPTDILDKVDVKQITEKLKEMLEIKNKEEQEIALNEIHTFEISEYLQLLDLIKEIDVVSAKTFSSSGYKTVVTQPGLRYSQAQALIKSLIADSTFRALSLKERNYVVERILSEIKGRMLEDIVLLETTEAIDRKKIETEVFKLEFDIGEIDMIICYPDDEYCEIYEIKHSSIIDPMQYRHLIDKKKCELIEHRYGEIKGKYVIYSGENSSVDGITYINVESYLNGLGSIKE